MAAKFHRCTRWLRNNFAATGWFRSLRNWPSSWSDLLPMAVTPSFQLQIVHRLKHWIVDFLSFEKTYSMHKLGSRKCSKSGWHDYHQEWFMADFSFLPLLAFRICLWQRTSKLWFFMFLSFSLLFHGFQITLLNLGLLWWSKSYQTPKLNTIWLELIARVLNMLIGLKGDNYYSKVFKRVNYKLSNNTFWVVIIPLLWGSSPFDGT